ncbi:MAG: hypothetical protein LBM07_00160 [Culturomica sp.]|jgi:hypothetical protein|nr:hypothetical protein [Culturomica sp.]
MNPIGGYLELELRRGEHYHKGALRLNTARNCFEYILLAKKYSKVYIPYYTCEVMLEPLLKCHVDYEFYAINKRLEPEVTIDLKPHEAFLYTNYFGLKQKCVERLADVYQTQLIVDNAQAFYAPALTGIDTFYSPRKFFGLPDGAYLYTDTFWDVELETDTSYNRMLHLLKRWDIGAEAGYDDFKANDAALTDNPIKIMSKLTDAMLASIDYETARETRRKNYVYLHDFFKNSNLLDFELHENDVPMIYPLLSKRNYLRQQLIRNKIFVAIYWHNVLDWAPSNSLECELVTEMLALPIDQRIGKEDLKRIIKIIGE